jgi:primosomal replication protein N''
VENVQGDERDVMIFSTTFGRNPQGTFRRNFGVLGQKGGERRLNVAVTRAREKVFLVTSLPVTDISDMLTARRTPVNPRDYLQAYLYYAECLSAGDLKAAGQLLNQIIGATVRDSQNDAAGEDGFGSTVAAFIGELGHLPVSSRDGGAFGIDYAIKHPRTSLFGIGIECDSPRHVFLNAARAREIWRPAVLRKVIPVVHRVSSHGWYHNRDAEKRRLAEAISAALS